MRRLNLIGILLAGATLAGGAFAQQDEIDPASGGIVPHNLAQFALGTLIAGPYDVETAPFDNRCLGVEEMGGFLWVTGGGHTSAGVWAYKIHQYSMTGSFIQSFPQVSNTTSWGGRDMASNGNTLYIGSDNAEVSEYSWNGVTLSHVTLRTVPVSGTVRALAQRPSDGHFFTKSFTSPFYEFDFTTQYAALSNASLSAYGFGWDDTNGSIWSTTSGPAVQEVDPATAGFRAGYFGPTWGTAQGGADCYADSRNPGMYSMVVLGQGVPDSVEVYDLAVPMGGGGPTLAVAGLVAGGTVTITASNCTPGGTVRHGYSTSGGGPIGTPWGNLLLSPPYTELPAMTMNGSGTGSFSGAVPPGTTGVSVWLHALDLGSLTFTNGLAEVIG